MFDDVGQENYLSYQQRHQTNITYIVGPVMLIELATAIALAWYPVEGVGRPLVYIGIALVVLIWLSTAFIQVPCHEKLVRGFDPGLPLACGLQLDSHRGVDASRSIGDLDDG